MKYSLTLSIAMILGGTGAQADNVLNVTGSATSTATAKPVTVAKPVVKVVAKPAPAKPAPKPVVGKPPVAVKPAPVVKAAPVTNVSSTANQSQAQQQSQGQIATGGNSTSTSAAQGGSSRSTVNDSGNSRSASLSGAEANNEGNTTTIQGDTYRAARIPVNTAIAGFQITTASCRYAEGLGIQAVPAAGSVGLTFKDKDCSRAELAQVFYARGADDAGDKLMCQIKLVREALGDDCLAEVHVLVVTQVAAPADMSQYATHEELNNMGKRLLRK